MTNVVGDKVVSYETFLNETLKEDLRKLLEERDKVYSQISEYLQLKTLIERIKEVDLNKEDLKTKVDLGCNFYVQANVPDTSRICVCVGYGFFVEFTHVEALRFIEKKTSHLNKRVESLTKDAARVKAHIKLVLEGLKEIQNIQTERPQPHRDIFS